MERKDFILVSPSSLFLLPHQGQGTALASTADRPFLGTVSVQFFSRTLWKTRVGLDEDTPVRKVHKKASERMQKGWRREECPASLSQKVVTSSLWNSTPSWPWGQTEGFSGTPRRGGLLSRPSVFSVIILSQRLPSSCITSQRGHGAGGEQIS